MTQTSLFHLAINVTDLDLAREFYGRVLGAEEGRHTDTWVDFNFFGHQLSLHLGQPLETKLTGKVDNILVPMPHFGLVLDFEIWRKIVDRVNAAEVEVVLPATARFVGQPGAQHTFFFFDPFGNPIELKSFEDINEVFAS